MLPQSVIRAAYELACRREIEALKPGNVHLFADGHRMSADQFLTSASVSSGPLTDPSLSVGTRIREAVRATQDAVATNTNLGIILLCAPLARAAEMPGKDLRASLQTVLDAMDLDDTAAVFEAIVLASPGGLGSASKHEVREKPKVHLLDAMGEARDRDMIARQYVTGFADIFEVGLPALDAALSRGETGMWPTIRAYLSFLTTLPDSHVLRKHGAVIAGELCEEAIAVQALLDEAGDETERIAILKAFDEKLKVRGVNPGTSADLTVACLLVHSLSGHLA
ncbi:triphosphoribosyl-dephospho-CoA synthase [Pseudaminobacter sp. NGMCC 1.201702]|uniref:triphosphoribosyl-dephospho-CoA synthase n=1 Tax=Pseudaminobacter sp. NGMCC 1.201702 TaxID=3391825 RepID=UPI0039EE8ED5